MLRVFGAFLLMFSLLSLIVHLDGMVRFFGVGGVVLLAIDLLFVNAAAGPRSSRIRREIPF